jgi:hypothetical protein
MDGTRWDSRHLVFDLLFQKPLNVRILYKDYYINLLVLPFCSAHEVSRASKRALLVTHRTQEKKTFSLHHCRTETTKTRLKEKERPMCVFYVRVRFSWFKNILIRFLSSRLFSSQ